jgi:nitrate reductase beta subunit
MKYLASLFSAGETDIIVKVYEKLLAVKLSRRDTTVGDLDKQRVEKQMAKAKLSKETADAIFRLTSLATFEERFVIPPEHREESIEMLEATADAKGETGFGFKMRPERGL